MAEQFYKYENSPTVYNTANQALDYNTYISQGGLKDFSNVLTLKGQTTPNLLQPTISSEQLKPTTPITVPPVEQPAGSPNGAVAGATAAAKSLDDYVKLLTPPTTEANTQYDTLANSISDILGKIPNKGQDQLTAEQNAGLPELKRQLAEVNGTIATKTAEYNAAFQALENQPQQTAAVVGSKQQQLQRTQAAEIQLYTARAQALQGNISAAQDTVNRAIDLKYSTYEAELDAKLKQLELAKDKMSTEQSRYADALNLYLTDQKQQLAEAKAKAKENINLALQTGISTKFVNRNGEFFNTTTGETYGNPADFFKAAGVSSFQQAYASGLVSDLNNAQINNVADVAALKAKYFDAGITLKDSPEVAAEKIKRNSQIYRKDTYIAKSGGGGGGVPSGGLKVSPALAAAIQNGQIDPNKLNSRTLSIYESIAQAGVDAVGAHAGAEGETKAIRELAAYKSVATRALGVIEKNLPLVADLADKVNKTGIPGLDDYIRGVKAYTGNNQDVVRYVNSIQTLRSEYAQMLAKGNATTESDKAHAAEAIPSGLSSAAYNALGDQLKLEAENILEASDDAIRSAKNKSASNSGAGTDPNDPLGLFK